MPRRTKPNPRRGSRGGSGWDEYTDPGHDSPVHDARQAREWWRSLSEDEQMEVMIGNAQGGWSRVTKYKDKNGNWVTDRIWGSGKAGW